MSSQWNRSKDTLASSCGSLPAIRPLPLTSKCLSCDSCPNSGGIGPETQFISARSSRTRFSRLPSSLGIASSKRVPLRSSHSSLRRLPSSAGMEVEYQLIIDHSCPKYTLSLRSKYSRSSRSPILRCKPPSSRLALRSNRLRFLRHSTRRTRFHQSVVGEAQLDHSTVIVGGYSRTMSPTADRLASSYRCPRPHRRSTGTAMPASFRPTNRKSLHPPDHRHPSLPLGD